MNCRKPFPLYWSFVEIYFEVFQKRISTLPSYWILVQEFIMPNLVEEYEIRFSGKAKQTLKLSKNVLFILGVSYKFILKSVKSLDRVLWAIEYWFKALLCQIWLTNTNSIFWESEAKLQTLQKLSAILEFPLALFWSLSKT